MMAAQSFDNKPQVTGTHPLKFALWLIIISITMMFAAFTSAYIVRREEGNWLEYDLPNILLVNTIILLLSSVFMQWSYFAAKKDNLKTLKVTLLLTIAFGLAFLIGQWEAWSELVQNNVFFGGESSNPSGSFMYVLTGVHGFHLITGLIFLLIVLISSFKYKVHSKNMLRLELCTIYWHFLGGLWIYLYIFLKLNH
ncbi:MAG: cytochrome c oxidase subunit 3 [Hymenobacteraceae bacterium]|nr:cytochrome c oxidase subunit 3 [Hymenobacteraceae bacterium]MDX5397575.1 cytochrome c oxidase subunit 3 [Hymenobacteraceae bacterium]MDX5442225.1 cytochrome c oxidase subunit 3 [Hymenobacteraceae bacterium]MDX5513655.1 cytochrome c oxidase subunit 3 [Hymenobacteraceae bacterium]